MYENIFHTKNFLLLFCRLHYLFKTPTITSIVPLLTQHAFLLKSILVSKALLLKHSTIFFAGIGGPASIYSSLFSSQEPNYFDRNQDCGVINMATERMEDQFCFPNINGGPFPFICETGNTNEISEQ